MSRSTLIQRYELLDRLGSGAMASVWRAIDHRLGRQVAVKILDDRLAADADFGQRFEREARHAASLSHPNIVTVYDYGIDGDVHYIVMELVTGESLASRLARMKRSSELMEVADVQRLGSQLLAGLAQAHAQRIVHRDIKPGNILLTPEGDAKLADFGIAKAAGDPAGATTTGTFLGTLSYAAPEQLEGQMATAASDQYSLGCVLYECLLGHPPFQAELAAGVVAQHLQGAPPALRQKRAEIPLAMEATLLRALQKDPERRFASADQMADAVLASAAATAGAAEPTVVQPVGAGTPRDERRERRRATVTTLPPALEAATRTSSPFVERSDEWQHLADCWDQATRNVRQVVFVADEAGIGKTRLVAEFASSLRAPGIAVLWGRTWEEPLVAYQPIQEALRDFMEACPPERLDHLAVPLRSDLAPLLPEMADGHTGAPSGEPDRFRLFSGIATLVESIAQDGAALVVLDDLQWADEGTLLWLSHLVRGRLRRRSWSSVSIGSQRSAAGRWPACWPTCVGTAVSTASG